MRCKHWMLLLTLLAAGLAGCGGSSESREDAPSANAAAPHAGAQAPTDGQLAGPDSKQSVSDDTSEPATAVSVFLDALRCGDDVKILQMYTVRAREEAAQPGEHFAPRGSDTAQFQVGQVEYVSEEGARVACTWTDLDQDGQPHTVDLLWMVRREVPGWRVAGMAAVPFPGEPPVLLDFENLEETKQKLDLLEEEIRQRSETEPREAQQPANPGNSLRR
ncbi:MAG: hypothetical protein ABIP48_11240 [Planctomycetota bacterium]